MLHRGGRGPGCLFGEHRNSRQSESQWAGGRGSFDADRRNEICRWGSMRCSPNFSSSYFHWHSVDCMRRRLTEQIISVETWPMSDHSLQGCPSVLVGYFETELPRLMCLVNYPPQSSFSDGFSVFQKNETLKDFCLMVNRFCCSQVCPKG